MQSLCFDISHTEVVENFYSRLVRFSVSGEYFQFGTIVRYTCIIHCTGLVLINICVFFVCEDEISNLTNITRWSPKKKLFNGIQCSEQINFQFSLKWNSFNLINNRKCQRWRQKTKACQQQHLSNRYKEPRKISRERTRMFRVFLCMRFSCIFWTIFIIYWFGIFLHLNIFKCEPIHPKRSLIGSIIFGFQFHLIHQLISPYIIVCIFSD